MRHGQNPFKTRKSIEPPAAITVGVLNSIPDQAGYFRGSFDVLKLCLASIRHHADQPFDLLVVDNGSCPEVRAYLEEELTAGRIDYLVLNKRNIGRPNGVRQVLRAASGDLVFYTDGDIYFKPGWMQAHLEIRQAYPNVGIVGGMPVRQVARVYTTSTLCWVESHKDEVLCEKGQLIPDEWSLEYARSIGYTEPERIVAEWTSIDDCRVVYQGVTAYVGASHMQFLTPREVIAALPHFRFDQATGLNALIMDQILEDKGLLRLSTSRPFVYHMGNSLSESWLVDEFKRLVGETPSQPMRLASSGQNLKHWFWGNSRVRGVLRRIYVWSLDRYYG